MLNTFVTHIHVCVYLYMPLENNNQKITCTISNAVSLTSSILLLFVYLFEERFFVLFYSIPLLYTTHFSKNSLNFQCTSFWNQKYFSWQTELLVVPFYKSDINYTHHKMLYNSIKKKKKATKYKPWYAHIHKHAYIHFN